MTDNEYYLHTSLKKLLKVQKKSIYTEQTHKSVHFFTQLCEKRLSSLLIVVPKTIQVIFNNLQFPLLLNNCSVWTTITLITKRQNHLDIINIKYNHNSRFKKHNISQKK